MVSIYEGAPDFAVMDSEEYARQHAEMLASLRTSQGEDEAGQEGEDEADEYTVFPHVCGSCGHEFNASADELGWMYEKSPFLPCGCLWRFLDTAF